MAVWKIGQQLWVRDYAGVHEAIRGFNWSPEVQDLVASFLGEFLHSYICIKGTLVIEIWNSICF